MGDSTTQGIPTSALQSGLDAVMDKTNAQELQMYTFAAKASFQQSMAQTLGGLAMDAGKAKPQT
jgi:hypothetical protein